MKLDRFFASFKITVLLLALLAAGQSAWGTVQQTMTFSGRRVGSGNQSMYTWSINGFLGQFSQPVSNGESQTFNGATINLEAGNKVTLTGTLLFAEADANTDVTTGSEVTLVFSGSSYGFYDATVKTLSGAVVNGCSASVSDDNTSITVAIPSGKTFGQISIDILPAINDQNTQIYGIDDEYLYLNADPEPVPTVVYKDLTLMEGTDYTITRYHGGSFDNGNRWALSGFAAQATIRDSFPLNLRSAE